MRPVRPTAVHKTDRLSELVCSNSFRGDKLDNAVGLLKEEMRRLGSLVMRAADESRVPAGAALAVDRERFSQAVTDAVEGHPLITVVREEVTSVPDRPRDVPAHHRDGTADVGIAVGGRRCAGRRGAPVFLRRHESDRPGREPRHGQGVSRVAWGRSLRGRRTGRVWSDPPGGPACNRLAASTMARATT